MCFPACCEQCFYTHFFFLFCFHFLCLFADAPKISFQHRFLTQIVSLQMAYVFSLFWCCFRDQKITYFLGRSRFSNDQNQVVCVFFLFFFVFCFPPHPFSSLISPKSLFYFFLGVKENPPKKAAKWQKGRWHTWRLRRA